MKITLPTKPYNENHYGKPWIARVDYSNDPKSGEWDFGTWHGVPGGAGCVEITAEPGDILATGQPPRNVQPTDLTSPIRFWQVRPSGALDSVPRDLAPKRWSQRARWLASQPQTLPAPLGKVHLLDLSLEFTQFDDETISFRLCHKGEVVAEKRRVSLGEASIALGHTLFNGELHD